MLVTIRHGGAHAVERIARLYLRAREAGARAESIPALVHNADEVREWIADLVIPKFELWIAESPAGMPVGMLALDGDWIDQLYVDPSLTGHGIGGQLLDLAKRERPRGLRLWTFVSNLGARRFYERRGFVKTERTDGQRNEERAPDIQYRFDPP